MNRLFHPSSESFHRGNFAPGSLLLPKAGNFRYGDRPEKLAEV